MFLIDDLILAPGSFVLWVMRKVHEAAQEELANDATRITTDLSELHRQLETGAISESEFDAREKEMLDRLDLINEQSEDFEDDQEDREENDAEEHNDEG
jgi:gas vesicle protein GvpG